MESQFFHPTPSIHHFVSLGSCAVSPWSECSCACACRSNRTPGGPEPWNLYLVDISHMIHVWYIYLHLGDF